MKKDELDTLKNIFGSCQYLESIRIWCGKCYIEEREVLYVIANHSPKNLHKLKIYHSEKSNLHPKELISFFSSWGERIPRKSLNLTITNNFTTHHSSYINEEIIEKYKKLGIIKDFKTENYDIDDYLFD